MSKPCDSNTEVPVLNIPIMGGEHRHHTYPDQYRRGGGSAIFECLRQKGEPPYASKAERRLIRKYWPGCLRPASGDEGPPEFYDYQRREVFTNWLGEQAAELLMEEGVLVENVTVERIGRTIGHALRNTFSKVKEKADRIAGTYESSCPEEEVDPQVALGGV